MKNTETKQRIFIETESCSLFWTKSLSEAAEILRKTTQINV